MSLCECGCSAVAPIARQTDTSRGYIKGHPHRYVKGHAARGQQHARKEERFIVEGQGYETPCHVWQLAITRKGYGQEWNPRLKRMDFAHRTAYERAYGEIPPHTEIDHLCRTRACVNPDHLEAVTHAVNIERGDTGNHRISVETRIRIQELSGTKKLRQYEIASLVGVSQQTVSRVQRGRR